MLLSFIYLTSQEGVVYSLLYNELVTLYLYNYIVLNANRGTIRSKL